MFSCDFFKIAKNIFKPEKIISKKKRNSFFENEFYIFVMDGGFIEIILKRLRKNQWTHFFPIHFF